MGGLTDLGEDQRWGFGFLPRDSLAVGGDEHAADKDAAARGEPFREGWGAALPFSCSIRLGGGAGAGSAAVFVSHNGWGGKCVGGMVNIVRSWLAGHQSKMDKRAAVGGWARHRETHGSRGWVGQQLGPFPSPGLGASHLASLWALFPEQFPWDRTWSTTRHVVCQDHRRYGEASCPAGR